MNEEQRRKVAYRRQNHNEWDQLLDLNDVKESIRESLLGIRLVKQYVPVYALYYQSEEDGKYYPVKRSKDKPELEEIAKEKLEGKEWKIIETDEGKEEVTEIETHQNRKLCNKKAVEDFMATIEGIVNVNTVGANLSGRDVEAIGRNCMYAIQDQIFKNNKEYDIDNPATANQIVSIIESNLRDAVSKAKGGRYLKHRETSEERKVIKTENDESKSRLKNLM